MVDPTEKSFRTIAGNIINSEGVTAVIRVSDDIDFAIGGYVHLQDGKLYTINSAMKDYSTAPKEAFRYFRTSPQVSWVLRVMQVQAPWSEQ